MRRVVRALIVAVVAIATMAVAAPTPASADPWPSLTVMGRWETGINPGSLIKVTGAGFKPGAPATITLGDRTLTTVVAKGDGSLGQDIIKLPDNIAPATYRVRAFQASAPIPGAEVGRYADFYLPVTKNAPYAWPSTYYLPPADRPGRWRTVNIQGRGYKPGEPINVYVNGQRTLLYSAAGGRDVYGSRNFDFQGEFDAIYSGLALLFPYQAGPSGLVEVRAEGRESGASATFTMSIAP